MLTLRRLLAALVGVALASTKTLLRGIGSFVLVGVSWTLKVGRALRPSWQRLDRGNNIVGFIGFALAWWAASLFFTPRLSMTEQPMTDHPLTSPFRVENAGNDIVYDVVADCTSVVFDSAFGTGVGEIVRTRFPFTELPPRDGFELMCDIKRARVLFDAEIVEIRFVLRYTSRRWYLPWSRTPHVDSFRFRTSRNDKGLRWTRVPFDAALPAPPILAATERARAEPRPVVPVLVERTDVPLFADPKGVKRLADVSGIVVVTVDLKNGVRCCRHLAPTTRKIYRRGQWVTWHFGERKWDTFYYRDLLTGQMWGGGAALEFVGSITEPPAAPAPR